MTIQVTRTEHSTAELRHIARVASDPDQARRLLAIAQILEGSSRTDAARNVGSIRAITCPSLTLLLKSTKSFWIVPETCVPTCTVRTALSVPVAVTTT